jgi:hypothetical protein
MLGGADRLRVAAHRGAAASLLQGVRQPLQTCRRMPMRTSDSVGCACTLNLMSVTVWPVATALDASWIRSAACSPKMCTPRISPVSFLQERHRFTHWQITFCHRAHAACEACKQETFLPFPA